MFCLCVNVHMLTYSGRYYEEERLILCSWHQTENILLVTYRWNTYFWDSFWPWFALHQCRIPTYLHHPLFCFTNFFVSQHKSLFAVGAMNGSIISDETKKNKWGLLHIVFMQMLWGICSMQSPMYISMHPKYKAQLCRLQNTINSLLTLPSL